MKRISLLKGSVFLALASILSVSCDKDFNSIGSDIVGETYFGMDKHEFTDVNSGYVKTGAVQANNLAVNSLGIYSNPAFGVSKSHFVTELQPSSYGITIGDNPVIDSVYLYVPYKSTLKNTDAAGLKTYELNEVYGGEAKFRLKVYENGYFLNDYNPNSISESQLYYSDQRLSLVEGNKLGSTASGYPSSSGSPLNNGTSSQNEAFFFDKSQRYIYKTNATGQYVNKAGEVLSNSAPVSDRVVEEAFAPGMWLDLNKDYFQKKLLNGGDALHTNAATFKNSFRGLYFNVEELVAGQGALASMEFTTGKLYVKYKYTNSENKRVSKTLEYSLKGNTVNFFENEYNVPSTNDAKLYVLGGGNGTSGNGSGTVAYLDVFGVDADANGVPDQLEFIRQQNWVINEAQITFFVDRDAMGNANQVEPKRLYLYDLKNDIPLVDYNRDTSTNTFYDSLNKATYDGNLISQDAKGLKYRFRITEYVKSCVKNADSTNYRLGLSAAQNILTATNSKLKTAITSPAVDKVPVVSVMSPLGTVLHGSATDQANKRIKLEIYYTKPN